MTWRTTDDVYRQIRARGWAPALWAHHPPEVKRAIWFMGWRPQVKQCFANCQRFLLGTQSLGLNLEVEYREGWIQTLIPMEHAWLIYKGEVLDLTLDPHRDVEYLYSHTASPDQILARIYQTKEYGPLYPRVMAKSNPVFEAIQTFEAMVRVLQA